jgi:transposase
MKIHANAALSWSGRRLLIERVLGQGWTLTEAAEAAGVSGRCARKWLRRFIAEGEAGLVDRSSAPHRVANKTSEDRVAVIVALRQLRMTAAEIAETLAMPLSTVSAILKRRGLGRLGRLGLEQPVRYERSRPGELVHIDVKKLGRIEGGAGKRVGGRTPGRYRPRSRDATGSLAARSVGSSCTSPSTTTADSPTPRCCPTRKRRRRSPSSTGPSPSSPATASRSGACSPTTARPTSRSSTPSPAATSASSTFAHDPADRRPTAKPNASSAPF